MLKNKNSELSQIKRIAELIIKNDDSNLKEFVKLHEGNFKGIDIRKLYFYIFNNYRKAGSKKEKRKIKFLIDRYKLFDSDTYLYDDSKKLNPDFENEIIKGINLKGMPEDVALALYDSLNRKLSFKTYNNDYKKDISKLELYDAIECNQWAFAYAYLINKYVGCAYVENTYHKRVDACVGKSIIVADATVRYYTAVDNTKLTDLARAKLGLKPLNFSIYPFDNTSIENLPTYKKLGHYDALVSDSEKPSDEEINELIDLIKETNKEVSARHNVEKSEYREIIEKIVFMNRLLRKSELKESIEIVMYLFQLFNTLLIMEKHTKLLPRLFYRELKEDYYECVPLLSVYLGELEKKYEDKEDKFIYLTFRKGEKELVVIDKSKIYEDVKKGILIYSWINRENNDGMLKEMGLIPEKIINSAGLGVELLSKDD